VTVEGRLGGILQSSQTITVDAENVRLFSFGFTGVDELDFFSTITAATTDPFGCGSSGCSQITFDNMDFSAAGPPMEVPEPSTALVPFSSLGLFTLSAWRRRNRR
jgi:hypothetical protein